MKTRENDWWRWAHCIVYGLKGQRGQQQILLPASIRLPRQCVVASGANVVSVAAGEASGIHLCEGSGGITGARREQTRVKKQTNSVTPKKMHPIKMTEKVREKTLILRGTSMGPTEAEMQAGGTCWTVSRCTFEKWANFGEPEVYLGESRRNGGWQSDPLRE